MKIVVCDDDALVYEQMKNIIASYSIVKNENLELTFYQTVEELLHAKHMCFHALSKTENYRTPVRIKFINCSTSSKSS